MTYPLFSLAKCSSQKAVKSLEDGADRLDRALDRVAGKVEKTCESMVEAIDRAIAHIEQKAVAEYLAPSANKAAVQQKAKQQIMNLNKRRVANNQAGRVALTRQVQMMQKQKVNQLRAEAALRKTEAAKQAMRRQQEAWMNTMHAGRTPKPSVTRRVYGAGRVKSVDRKEERTRSNGPAFNPNPQHKMSFQEAKEQEAKRAAKKAVFDVMKRAALTARWGKLVHNRMGLQAAIDAQMIQARSRHMERASCICGELSEEEEDIDASDDESEEETEEEEETESETDLEFDVESEDGESEDELEFSDYSSEEEEEEEDVDEAAVANWEQLVATRMAKHNVAQAKWASLVDQKLAKKEMNVGRWEALVAKMTSKQFFIGDFYAEDNEVDSSVERELYFIGGESQVMTDVENQVGVLRETVSDSESERAGIETEAEMWEHIGTSDVESEDDEEADDEAEEAEKEEEVVETKRGWFW